MEVPRIWRQSPASVGFKIDIGRNEESKVTSLRYPGGEIPLSGDLSEIENRLLRKGFKNEEIEEILFTVFGGISAEAPVSEPEVVESFLKFLRIEVGEQNRSEVELGVDRLPR